MVAGLETTHDESRFLKILICTISYKTIQLCVSRRIGTHMVSAPLLRRIPEMSRETTFEF